MRQKQNVTGHRSVSLRVDLKRYGIKLTHHSMAIYRGIAKSSEHADAESISKTV